MKDFRTAVAKQLGCTYLDLKTGKVVFGNSVTSIKDHLRYEWRGLSRLEDKVEPLGFSLKRGRTQRIYHGGVYGWGVECWFVTENVEVPCFDKHEAYKPEFNGFWPGYDKDYCVEPELN